MVYGNRLGNVNISNNFLPISNRKTQFHIWQRLMCTCAFNLDASKHRLSSSIKISRVDLKRKSSYILLCRLLPWNLSGIIIIFNPACKHPTYTYTILHIRSSWSVNPLPPLLSDHKSSIHVTSHHIRGVHILSMETLRKEPHRECHIGMQIITILLLRVEKI